MYLHGEIGDGNVNVKEFGVQRSEEQLVGCTGAMYDCDL